MTVGLAVGAWRPLRRRTVAIAALAAVAALALLVVNAVVPYLVRRSTLMSEVAAQLQATAGLAITTEHARFDLLPVPSVALGGVHVADAAGLLDVRAERLDGTVRLLPLLVGRVELASVRLVKPRIIVRSGSTPGAIDPFGRALASLRTRANGTDSRLGVLTLLDGTLEIADRARPAGTRLSINDATLDWRTLDASATLNAALVLGGTTVDLAAWVENPAGLARQEHSAVALRLHAASGDLSANGDLAAGARTAFKGRVVATAPSLAALAATADPDLRLPAPFANATLGAAATLSLDRTGVATLDLGDLDLRADGNAFEGTLAYVGGARPLVSGTLATSRLSLAPLLDGLQQLAPGGAWSRTPIDFPRLGGIDLDLRFSAARLRVGPVTVDDAALSVMTRSERVDVGLNGGKAYGGAVKGRVSLGALADGVNLRAAGTLTGAELAGLSWDSFGRQLATGTLSASANLEASGDSVAALMRNLQGWARAQAADGEFSTVDLDRSLRDVAAGAPSAWRPGRTAFTSATLGMRMADGVATVDEGAMRSPEASTEVAGTADLGTRLLDLTARLRAPDLPDRRVAIGGGLDGVTLKPDTGATATP